MNIVLNQDAINEWLGHHGKWIKRKHGLSCAHEFPDTGMRKSWCKVFDCEGHFDFESGEFKPV